MTDIVERLRHAAGVLERGYPLLDEAADEIERLRALVGAARLDPGFREITGELQRRSTEPPNGSCS